MPRSRKRPYEYFSVSADILVWRELTSELLLIRRKNPPFKGRWALPGGFLDRDEDALQAARRELLEETGIKSKKLVQLGAFSDPGRDPRGRTVTIAFYTTVGPRVEPRAGDDAREAKFFPVKRLPSLAFDHREIIRQFLYEAKN